MTRAKITVISIVLLTAALPLAATAVTAPKTGTEYPDEIVVQGAEGPITLRVTGVGLREKTFLKVNIYTIVSYIAQDAPLGDDPAVAIRTLDVPKLIQMDLLRSFSRQKLVDMLREVIDKNYESTAAFETDLETFLAGFTRDAEKGDRIIFEYLPGRGLTTTLNGKVCTEIANPAFVEALWTVWFGEKPANEGLKRALLSALDT